LDEAVPLSALQHWRYCPRQCGLIHLEQVFDENVHTLRGQAVHSRVDLPGVQSSKVVRVERALPLWNDDLGLIGKADVVEFLSDGTPYPVEYKHGSRNKAAEIAACDDLQLAGQALCLEFMTGKNVLEGAIFYATSKRRRVVAITSALRHEVMQTAKAFRQMISTSHLPPVLTADKAQIRCRACSLVDRCQPTVEQGLLAHARAALFTVSE
jgi:CRISPR-associated exonuclease Cas4